MGHGNIFTPPTFAPAITYKGIEDIRFAPGWAKAGSNEYWTYACLWNREDSVHIDANIIATSLKAYYTGLIASIFVPGLLHADKLNT